MKPIVRVVGVALLIGCQKSPPEPERVYTNPPKPAEPEVVPPATPAATLPSFDSVPSGHPEGATNPPRPLLVVARDTQACFKDWIGGMVRPSPEEAAIDGRVVDTEAAAGEATRVQCPEGQPAELLAAWEAWKAGPK